LWGNSAEHKKVAKFEYKNVVKVTSHNDYLEKIKSASEQKKLTVVDFFAVWCGPCVRISPKFADLSEQFSTVQFLKVNVDELKETSKFVGITCMPTFKFYKDGTVVHTIEGADVDELIGTIEKFK